MELIERPTLGEKIRQGPIPLDEALVISIGVAGNEIGERCKLSGGLDRDVAPATFSRVEVPVLRLRFDSPDTDDPPHDTHKVLQFNHITRDPEVGVLTALLHTARRFEWSLWTG